MGRLSESARESSYARCVSLLRRGVLSGDDAAEVCIEIERTFECVGLSLAFGYRLAAVPLLRNIDPDWPAIYGEHASADPGRRFLARNGPYAVFSVRTHSEAHEFKRPLYDAFTRIGFEDAAIMQAGRSGAVLCLYRPRGQPTFDAATLTRTASLLPFLELALSCTSALAAIEASPHESQKNALRRLDAYAVLRKEDMWLSPNAERLFTSLFIGFGARGRRRIERAIRLAYARFLAGTGGRVFRLRTDLHAELSLLPRPGADASVIVTFVRPTRIASAPAALPCDELLSPTQRRVARALIDGATIPAIAATLGCGHDSVKAHVREIYQRLGVTSRTELVALYTS
ncbi:MAG: LuxR C-terminal-related transcriptional regulator [Labilithrix sp.]